MKTALITGISGQDGAYLSEFLLKKNYKIIGTDRRSARNTNWRLRYLGIEKKILMEEMELSEINEISRLFEKYKIDEVYNFAAQSFVSTSFKSPLTTSDVTALGPLRILEVIRKTKFKNLDIVTSNVDLSGLEVETAGDSNRSFILKEKLTACLNDSRASYDYVLIDCPPSLSLLTVMSLVTSNSLLVPLQAEFFALEGLTQLIKTIDRIKVNLNPDLKIRGILLTMYDKRNKLSSQVEAEARDYFGDKVYATVIPRNVRLSEAPSHGMPVLIYDKSCPGSKSYYSFTDEFINQERIIGSAA